MLRNLLYRNRNKRCYLKIGLTTFFLLWLFRFNSQTANYISNGGFEKYKDCSGANQYLSNALSWDEIDSDQATVYCNVCLNTVPNSGWTYQFPHKGAAYLIADMLCFSCATNLKRTYLKNNIKTPLKANQIYCVKFYVNIGNKSSYGIDGFGIYFGSSNEIDTITQGHVALTYLHPQVENVYNNIINDTLNWTSITGTFVAKGNEKYAIIGNFKTDAATNKYLLQPTYSTNVFCTVCVDDVSCIPIDLTAYAGPDKSCVLGDSVFIGRTPDIEIDESCQWFKLPNMSTPFATVAGLYVKPVVTTTYVVRQQLWCSGVKWDTVVVYQDFVGINELSPHNFWDENEKFKIYPNPAGEIINVECSILNGLGINDVRIKIADVSGRELENNTLQNDAKLSINTSQYQTGIYFVTLFYNGNATETKKLTILK